MGRLEDKAFGFLQIPARSVKPRETGQTIVADKWLGLHALDDLLEVGGDFVDWGKICISSPRILSRDLLRRKIERYGRSRVEVFLTGDVFELAINQGVVDRVYEETAALGCQGIEVASAQVILSIEDKARLVRRAAAHGLKVFAEVGKKGAHDRTIHSGYLLKEIDAMLAAGAYRVLVQGEGLVEGVAEIREEILFDIATRFELRDLVFQAKDARAHAWFIAQFGPEVNLDIDSDQVVPVELCRRGLRRRGLFGLVAAAPEPEAARRGGEG
ncbi:MAG TPA: phosphosulfolactate synthase [Thermodesulfobacteriota bacterium]|nr:phosphosulfolactate synthase [Thermodesulfobacteriota bacterium]